MAWGGFHPVLLSIEEYHAQFVDHWTTIPPQQYGLSVAYWLTKILADITWLLSYNSLCTNIGNLIICHQQMGLFSYEKYNINIKNNILSAFKYTADCISNWLYKEGQLRQRYFSHY